LPRATVTSQATHVRRVYIGNAGGWINAQIFDRNALEPGFNGTGPAVIEEYGSTTMVWPGDRFEIGVLHEIRIQCSHR
jgi:N-methylhydantoinase A/oxoprolinase/acetone carboxylase beta subunit